MAIMEQSHINNALKADDGAFQRPMYFKVRSIFNIKYLILFDIFWASMLE